MELHGESVLSRLLQQLQDAGIGETWLLLDSNLGNCGFDSPESIRQYATSDVWNAAAESLLNMRTNDVTAAVLTRAAAYVDFDPA